MGGLRSLFLTPKTLFAVDRSDSNAHKEILNSRGAIQQNCGQVLVAYVTQIFQLLFPQSHNFQTNEHKKCTSVNVVE